MKKHLLFKSTTVAAACAIAAILSACGEVPKDTPASSGTGTGATTYTVGGTVTGLSASGLTLANATDTLDLASGAAAFTMPTALSSGAAYALSITKAPLGFTLACSLANGSGTVASANITSATVTCAASAATVAIASLPGSGGAAPGSGGTNGATLASSSFSNPVSIVQDSTGNFYVLDAGNNAIRKIAASDGAVTTINSTLISPTSMTLAKDGNLYVYDSGSIVQVTPSGVATTIAGSTAVQGSADGLGSLAQFDSNGTGLGYIAADPVSGNLYIADTGNNMIRMVTPAGLVSTTAGTLLPGAASASVATNLATFNFPVGIAVDSLGNVYVGDTSNAVIRQIQTSGNTIILAGSGVSGTLDSATPTTAQVQNFANFSFDASGNLYFTEPANGKIRMFNTASGVKTIVGGTSGFLDGSKATAQLDPMGLAIDALGNAWVADGGNNAIRKIAP